MYFSYHNFVFDWYISILVMDYNYNTQTESGNGFHIR